MAYKRAEWRSGLTYMATCDTCKTVMKYMDDKVAKEDKLFDDPSLMKTPVVRNGKQATVGFCPEIWQTWE